MRTQLRVPLLLLAVLVVGCSDPAPVLAPGDAPARSLGTAPECRWDVADDVALARIDGMLLHVDELGTLDALNAGQATALREHLQTARAHVQERRYCAADAQLRAFRQQVEGFRRAGLLTDRQLSPMLQAARVLLPTPALPGDVPEMYAPGVVGEVRTIQLDGGPLRYEVIDGLAIYQSDVILGYADEVEGRAVAPAGGEIGAQSGVCRDSWSFGCARWTDGIIGYDFAFDWGLDNETMRRRIEAAIFYWRQNTGMRFERRTGGERIVFRNSSGCSSAIGRRELTGAEPQWVNLNPGCGLGAVIHEIAHAVGLYHEQSRRDRDDHVRVYVDRVLDGRAHNFDQYAWDHGRDVGPYDYFSRMHYGCGAFSREGAGNTIEPLDPAVTCDRIGNSRLSEGDILGVYTLYPPVFAITGATPGETRDRFELGLDFTTSPGRADHVQWTSDRVPGVLATGHTLSTAAVGLPAGAHRITASVVVLGTTLASRSIALTVFNEPPAVDLGPDRTVALNRDFFVTATVTDAEDGVCTVPVCRFAWDPPPQRDQGGTATYRYTSTGPRTITATVTDGAGATGSGSVTVMVVNSPPQPFIDVPASGATFSPGATLALSGYALDANVGPGPGPGLLWCGRLTWSSSDPSDTFVQGCSPTVTFGSAGPREISLTAMDPNFHVATASVQVTVVDCGASCPPDVSFVIDTPSALDGALYSPPFTGPGYDLASRITMTGTIGDADSPPDNPIDYEWRLTRPCFSTTGSCPPDLVLGTGAVDAPDGPGTATASLTWRPLDHVAAWDFCTSVALPFTVRLWARDRRGATNVFSRTIHLACVLQ